ncbi:hypothetical protein ACIBI9_47745 [Nonomuraea sp. NPDC050451]|uniref:MmyB family transcriptional regulator n=1 Tax=Nonomuraea sp. NPDC050451 TaxID=3364364 RepID=UPI003789433F
MTCRYAWRKRPSPSVVDALARALLLDDHEHEHLRDLAACAARPAPEPSLPPSRSVQPGIRPLLESLRPNPAHVVSRTMDVLACNPSGMRLFAGMEKWPVGQRNVVRYVFLHPDAPDLFDDWDEQIRGCVGRLRAWPAPSTPRSPPRTTATRDRTAPPLGGPWQPRGRSYGVEVDDG